MLFNGALSDEPLSYMVRISNSVSSLTVDALEKTASKGGTVVIRIDGNSLDGVTIKDNGIDIKNQLVSYSGGGDLTYTALAQSYTTSGTITNSSYASRPIGVPAETDNTYTNRMYGSGSTAYVYYLFDFSEIPSDATDISVEVKVKAHRASSSSAGHMILYNGSTTKSSTTNIPSTTDSLFTINNGSYTWTLEELQDSNANRLRVYLGSSSSYGVSVAGISWNVNYSIPVYNYWEYTISNINETHNIVIS